MKRAMARTGAAVCAGWADGSSQIASEKDTFKALGTGSVALVRRPCQWCAAGDGMDAVWRAFGLAWVVAAVGVAVYQAWYLVLPIGLVWCIVALRLGAPDAPPKKIDKEAGEPKAAAAEEPDCEAEDEPNEPLPAPTNADFIRTLAGLLDGRSGTLLRTIAATLHESGVDTSYGIPEVRVQCAALGIPVKPTVKTPEGSSSGVNAAAFRAALQALAEGADEGPDEGEGDPSPEAEPAPALEAGSSPR